MTRSGPLSVEDVVRDLRLPPTAVFEILELGEHAPTERVELPADPESLLDRLGVQGRDRRELLAARPDPVGTPALWWLLERCVGLLRERQGTVGPLPLWPPLPDELGPVGRYLYAWALLAAVPSVRAFHASRGVPDELSWAALGVLPSHLADKRALTGTGGLRTQQWLTHHYRGAVYDLGALHLERTLVGFDAGDAPGAPPAGALALGVHIPWGRIPPEACDRSLAAARSFFARCFPDEPYRYATCYSWVLDPQLREYLPPGSNILRFQERFTLVPDPGPPSGAIVQFVFERDLADVVDPAQLPQDTTLQRAIVAHLAAGRDWHARTGWFAW